MKRKPRRITQDKPPTHGRWVNDDGDCKMRAGSFDTYARGILDAPRPLGAVPEPAKGRKSTGRSYGKPGVVKIILLERRAPCGGYHRENYTDSQCVECRRDLSEHGPRAY
jgi:hypothetical protein